MRGDFQWPRGLDPDTICFTVDVEWAAEEVFADLRRLFDQHGVRAIFFVTRARRRNSRPRARAAPQLPVERRWLQTGA
jgi:hypothetical protein